MARILVVDSTELMLKLIVNVLSASHEVSGVSTDAEARELLREGSFEAFILGGVFADNGSEHTSCRLIFDIREGGFTGPMFASSKLDDVREMQMQSGCDHEFDKGAWSTWLSTVEQALESSRSG